MRSGQCAAMAAYRTRIAIVGNILETAGRGAHGSEGATVTHLIRAANVPHGRLSATLRTLVSQGLLEQVDSAGACRYRTSKSGREFLGAYESFRRFSDSYGLSM